jgi:UDP-glucose 4-epimerase
VNWLVTGGCGFIGAALVGRLRAEGRGVRVIDDCSVGQVADLEERAPVEVVKNDAAWRSPAADAPVQVVVADIRDAKAMHKAAEGVDVIAHLAASTGVLPSIEDPIRDLQINVDGTVGVLEAARVAGVRRFILASSGAALGEQEPPLHEGLCPRPVSPYGAGKLAGEAYCSAYHCSYGLGTIGLRFGNAYGPGSRHKGSVVAKFIRDSMRGQTVEVFGDGGQTRDFIFVDDIVDAIWASAHAKCGGEVFQIATGREVTVNEMLDVLKSVMRRCGLDMNVEYRPARDGEVKRSYSDTGKAREMLGWRARVELPDGLERTVRWFVGR